VLPYNVILKALYCHSIAGLPGSMERAAEKATRMPTTKLFIYREEKDFPTPPIQNLPGNATHTRAVN
jgi:hypothetical protein